MDTQGVRADKNQHSFFASFIGNSSFLFARNQTFWWKHFKGNEDQLQAEFLLHKRISATKTVKYVHDMSNSAWKTSVLDADTPNENNNDNSKDSFYKEWEQVFCQLVPFSTIWKIW